MRRANLMGDMKDSVVDEQADGCEFCFSYIHNVLTGVRTYSNLDFFTKLRLVRPDSAAEPLRWRDLIVPEDLELYDRIMSLAVEHGGNHKLHYRVRDLDGRALHVREYCGLARGAGNWPALVGSVVSNESQLSRAREAERQAMVGRLSSGIVHDFRNLLTGIQNIIEWCGDGVEPGGEIHNALRKTVSYTEQAGALINSLLSLTGGKDPEEESPELLDVGMSLRDLEPLLRHVVTSAVRLELAVEPGLPSILGTASALRDMLVNLCSNAREAMDGKGGRIAIRAFQCELPDTLGRPQRFVLVQIEDSGKGIPEDKLESIFELFSSSKKSGGGFGLWMVREAARSFDGTVRARSQLGKGAVFELAFPAVEEPVGRAAAKELAAATADGAAKVRRFGPGNRRTVLLVEDEPLIISGVTNCLESIGCEVLAASDGLDALELFKRHQDRIDVVVQDYILPGRTGGELLKDFQGLKPGVPVIVVSGYPEGKQSRQLETDGAFAFLPKPFRLEQLIELIHQAVGA